MTPTQVHVPNPKRVAAGKRNHAKRKGLTPEGRQRLREAAFRNRPWQHSTGPRTPEGKAQAAKNGKVRQLGPRSVREIRADLADLRGLIQAMKEAQQMTRGAGLV